VFDDWELLRATEQRSERTGLAVTKTRDPRARRDDERANILAHRQVGDKRKRKEKIGLGIEEERNNNNNEGEERDYCLLICASDN
jgi:hypothetical protein